MAAKPFMTCGCYPNAHRDDGTPTCAIHGVDTVRTDQPDLTGRTAECAYGGAAVPSSTDLAFFEYCGEGTSEASSCKHCHYYFVAHGKGHARVCENYEAQGDRGKDRYYCGCRGWD